MSEPSSNAHGRDVPGETASPLESESCESIALADGSLTYLDFTPNPLIADYIAPSDRITIDPVNEPPALHPASH